MEFRHLRCFVALADELHFGRAARRVAMSQPPFSVNIRQLEEAVGARLFERDSRGVRLTAAGEAFRPHATSLLSKAEEAKALAREVDAGAIGRLRVGFVGSMLFRGLPAMLQRFRASQPRIELVLHELNSQEQIQALASDELDLAFLHTDRVQPPLTAQLISEEQFVACMPEGHPAAARRRIALASLSDEPFVLFSRAASPDYHARIIGMCHQAGFDPRIGHEVRHWLSVVAVVAQGMGVSLVPSPMERSGIRGAVFRPLSDAAMLSTVFAVWNPEVDLPARDRFVKEMGRGQGRAAQ
ncbi:MAG: LysR family transcriptional regulator [Planctomycetes bacterium]|nr:LysR family transcriptional regulator [Planctomycetota bacterium]